MILLVTEIVCLQLPFGRDCISHYKLVRRLPVFSHEELVCKMAADPDSMDLQLAAQTHSELMAIVAYECKHRGKLLDMVSHCFYILCQRSSC